VASYCEGLNLRFYRRQEISRRTDVVKDSSIQLAGRNKSQPLRRAFTEGIKSVKTLSLKIAAQKLFKDVIRLYYVLANLLTVLSKNFLPLFLRLSI
jgi:hypothetical protein